MKRIMTTALIAMTIAAPVKAQNMNGFQPNAYGLGVGMNAYGQPIRHGSMNIQKDAYGLGTHSDQYGRALKVHNGELKTRSQIRNDEGVRRLKGKLINIFGN